jgi:hypothetical protein
MMKFEPLTLAVRRDVLDALQRRDAARPRDDERPLAGELLRDGQADALARPGDHGNLVSKAPGPWPRQYGRPRRKLGAGLNLTALLCHEGCDGVADDLSARLDASRVHHGEDVGVARGPECGEVDDQAE